MEELYNGIVKLRWDAESKDYQHFTDLGHYMLDLKGITVKSMEAGIEYMSHRNDGYAANCCSGTIKKNNKGEVLMSHSMDIEISERPGFITNVTDGKYNAVLITYVGSGTKYKYNELEEMDKDWEFLQSVPLNASDVMNEAGLYMALDMRCGDAAGGMDCTGTNPGKVRACAISAPALVGINCGTVKEAIEFLNNSYDWYTLYFKYENGQELSWNMAFLIGDATGEYGLVEFGRNGVHFTPYQCFQSNYYIHPLLSERAVINHGHGRAAALLGGLMDVQTEQEIMENQRKSRYRHQMENPSWEYYSDVESLADVNVRRTMPAEEQAKLYDEAIIHAGGFDDNMEQLALYYKGEEEGLRAHEYVWVGSITSGINCAQKRGTIQMFENETFFDIEW